MSLRALPMILLFPLITVLPACSGDAPPAEEPAVEEPAPAPEPEVKVGPTAAMKGMASVDGDAVTFTACGSEDSLTIDGDAGLGEKLAALTVNNGQVAYVEFDGGMIEGGDPAVQISKVSLVEARGQNVACSGGADDKSEGKRARGNNGGRGR